MLAFRCRSEESKTMKMLMGRYFAREDGATAIEYSLIASGIALSIVAIVFLLGDEVLAMFNDIAALFV